LWDALSLSNPDVLLLDAGMSDAGALDVCRMIRNETRWSTLPIFVLGPVDDAGARATGVDEVLPRNLDGAQLILNIQSRMRRIQIYRSFGQMDALTGTSSIEHSKQLMQQLLHLSERQKQPFTLLVTQIDQIETIRQNDGPSAADVVQHRLAHLLIQFFRTEDVVARWSGDEFVVALFGIDRDRAVGRAAQLLKKITQNPFPEPEWASIPVTLSAGLAQFPVDGENLDDLHDAASQAFQMAHENGGNRALRSGEAPAPTPLLDRADVVVVDGNTESIGPVVEALQDDKLSVRWLHSGEEAIRILTGSSRSLGTSLVLLAAELPDIDGFLVFRQLLREVVVRNVIIMADAPSQDQVLTALQLGALDYISRPFDIPAIVERVRQALQE
jgi:diguanylate cyclase (GGDEF)-like protein